MIPSTKLLTAIIVSLSFAESAYAIDECGPSGGNVSIAGSTHLFPLVSLWVEKYNEHCPDTNIIVEAGGSRAGAARLCDVKNNNHGKPVDIAAMSRPWQVGESIQSSYGYVRQCLNSTDDRSAIKIDIAIDGIAIATNGNGTAASCIQTMGGLTTHQLRWIYSNYDSEKLIAAGWDPNTLLNSDKDDNTHLWSELDPRCPPIEIQIGGLNNESGTFEYFFDQTCLDYDYGETADYNRATGYYTSSNERDILMFLETNDAAIAFFGSFSFLRNSRTHFLVPIQNKAGDYVVPTTRTLTDGTYTTYSRRLYMNILNDAASLDKTRPFLHFALSEAGTQLVEIIGFVPISVNERQLLIQSIPSHGESLPITPLSSLSFDMTETDEDPSTTTTSTSTSTSTSGSSSSSSSSSSFSGIAAAATRIIIALSLMVAAFCV